MAISVEDEPIGGIAVELWFYMVHYVQREMAYGVLYTARHSLI